MNDILEYKNYFATVNFNAEDEVFHGKVIGINDLVTFEGTSVEQLKAAFCEAVEDYLETCAELGKEPEKTYKGSFNIRIPSELHREAARHAALKNMSLNDFVRYAIDYLIHKVPDKRMSHYIILTATLLPALMAGFLFSDHHFVERNLYRLRSTSLTYPRHERILTEARQSLKASMKA